MESLNGVNAITIVFAALCIFAIAYRFYGLWVAQKVLNINAARETPANRFEDGKDYVPTNKYVLFGHHFAAIAAAGPLLGPVLAAQFGYLPGLLWILIGCVLAGGVHDMVVLFCSVRHRGKSLAYIASQEIDTTTGRVAAWAVLAILLLTLAGLSIAVVNAMHNSLWSTYTVFCTIPIAVLMGLYMQVWRKGDVRGATIMGVVLLFLCILSGPWVASHPEYFGWLDIDKPEMSLIIPAYGFLASVLPVWLLLLPRDYLSTFLKIGTIGALAIGIAFVMPTFHMPAITEFIHGGGPIIGGPVIPFLFITIACGALSGFHATIGTGTTPKMINNEKDVLFVGYGAMLMEGFVAVMALVAARQGRTVTLRLMRDYRSKSHIKVWGIQARNAEQNMALNLLMDPDIDFVTLLGQAGTGKTLMTLAAALTQTIDERRFSEIIMTRATVSVGEDIGFLPGTEEEKMAPWMGALEDNLEVLHGSSSGGDWGRQATMDLIKNRIRVKSMSFMRGRTFLQKFVIIDEAQNLSPKQMKTLITRAGPGTKIVCLGNIAQIDTPYLTEGSSGLTYVVERFQGWQHAATLTLTRGERSRLAEFAAEAL